METPPNAHAIVAAPSNRHVLATSLGGGGVVLQYCFNASSGRLTPNVPPTHAPQGAASPRHLRFSADSRFVYLLGELDATIDVLAFDGERGLLDTLQTTSTLPPGFAGKPWAADLHLKPDDRLPYASERRSSSLAGCRAGLRPTRRPRHRRCRRNAAAPGRNRGRPQPELRRGGRGSPLIQLRKLFRGGSDRSSVFSAFLQAGMPQPMSTLQAQRNGVVFHHPRRVPLSCSSASGSPTDHVGFSRLPGLDRLSEDGQSCRTVQLSLEKAVGRTRVGCDAAGWQGWSREFGQPAARLRNGLRLQAQTRPARATTLRAYAREEKQRGQRAAALLTRVRSALTQPLKVVVRRQVNIQAVYPAEGSGQLPFLAQSSVARKAAMSRAS